MVRRNKYAVINLKPGQFVFEKRRCADQVNVSATTALRYITKLHLDHVVDHETDHEKRIITICNWDTYNMPKNSNGPCNGPCTSSNFEEPEKIVDHEKQDAIPVIESGCENPESESGPCKNLLPSLSRTRRRDISAVTETRRPLRDASLSGAAAAAAEESELGSQTDLDAAMDDLARSAPELVKAQPRVSWADYRICSRYGHACFVGRDEKDEWNALWDRCLSENGAQAVEAMDDVVEACLAENRSDRVFLSQVLNFLATLENQEARQ